MYEAVVTDVAATRGRGYQLTAEGHPLSWEAVLDGWAEGAEFSAWFTSLLAGSPYKAFRWETPGLTAASLDRPFEFVLLDDPGLQRRADPRAFAEHFPRAADGVVAVDNLRGDARLVIPTPAGDATGYVHLAAFVRRAPAWQQHRLWQAVAAAVHERVAGQALWLSTAGAGVAWLHVRLDDRPKYYNHSPYRTPPPAGS